MRKIAPALLVSLLVGHSPFAAAVGPIGANIGAGVSVGGGGAALGGHSSATIQGPAVNGQAYANSNGRFAADRDTGNDRAQDRMSLEGQAHEKASGHFSTNRNHRDAKGGPGTGRM